MIWCGLAVHYSLYSGWNGLALCRPILDEVAQVQYELSDVEYAANEVEDTWVQSLLGRLGAYLNALQPLLTPANYEQLVSLLLEKVRQPVCNMQGCIACSTYACSCEDALLFVSAPNVWTHCLLCIRSAGAIWFGQEGFCRALTIDLVPTCTSAFSHTKPRQLEPMHRLIMRQHVGCIFRLTLWCRSLIDWMPQ